MFTHRHYIPILKAKRGELGALSEFEESKKEFITPLIELTPLPLVIKKDGERRKTIDEHLIKLAPSIKKSWDSSSPLYLDTRVIQDDVIMDSGVHFLEHLYNEAMENSLNLIPVIDFERQDIYRQNLAKIIKRDKNGVCLRLDTNSLFSRDFKSNLEELLKSTSLSVNEVDLIIDLKSVTAGNEDIIIKGLVDLLLTLPYVNNFRTLTISSSSFPYDMSKIGKNESKLLPRLEWETWLKIIQSDKIRKPSFSDYGISHPISIDFNPKTMQTSANIRYSTKKDWLIVKGSSTTIKIAGVKTKSYKQYFDLSKSLIARKEYLGKDFSWGDDYIYKCANNNASTANQEVWRKIGTNHHLTLVTNQISSLS